MTVPQKTQFLPAAHQKNSVKSVAKVKVQASLTSSAPSHHLPEQTTTAVTALPDPPTKHEKPSHTTPIPGPSVQAKLTNRYESEKGDTDGSSTAEHENEFNAYQLVDITPPKLKHQAAAGRPKKGTLNLFLQKCFQGSQPGKHLNRCIGVGCKVTFSNRNLQ